MKTVYTMDSTQMKDWKLICKTFAENEGAELVFVNEASMGLQYPNGDMRHIYIDELVDILKAKGE